MPEVIETPWEFFIEFVDGFAATYSEDRFDVRTSDGEDFVLVVDRKESRIILTIPREQIKLLRNRPVTVEK